MARGSWFRRPPRNGNGNTPVPEGLWRKCPKCGEILFAKDVERNLNVCPRCEYHHKLRATERIALLMDEESFQEFDTNVTACDPLGFPDYAEKITIARTKTGQVDAILTGYARMDDNPCIIGVADFAFMGGSMGSVVGEKIVRAMERAVEEKLPVILVTANGGGARMQEGLLSLMQMAKTSAAVARMGEAGVPYIVVLTDPTMAGVYASYAALGDVIVAEPGALIGFAGRRVGNQDMGVKLPDDFQTSEFQARCGMVDRVIHRKDMRATLATLLANFANRPTTTQSPTLSPTALLPLNKPLDFEKPIVELDNLIAELKQVDSDPLAHKDALTRGIDMEAEIMKVENLREEKIRQIFTNLTPWNEVQMARHEERPYTLDYIRMLFTDFVELSGDRINADDPAIVGGLARFNGEAVVVMGHQKGRDLKQRQYRNFGSARPAGFRKALRLMKLAERFHKPLIVFVDTPAAEANLPAEEEGISTTIAVCLREMAVLKTPIVVAIVGEGGSGGALGIAVGDRILMLEHSVYSVIPPEGCAAILWNDRSRAADAAAALKLTARHACEFELVDELLPEPLGGAHRNPGEMAETLRQAIEKHLKPLKKLSHKALIEARYAKFRRMGRWEEPEK